MTQLEILQNIALIGRAVSAIESRFTIRVLRTLMTLRKKLDKKVLRSTLEKAFPPGCEYIYPRGRIYDALCWQSGQR